MRIGIVAAGGTGERFGRAGGKQLAEVHGVPVVTHALRAFDAAETIDAVLLVCPPDRVAEYQESAVEAHGIRKVTEVVAGGETRQLSIEAGLARVPDAASVLVVHDGARPLVQRTLIDQAVYALEEGPGVDAVVVGHPCLDTIKVVDHSAWVVSTPPRETLWAVQTPQVFRRESLVEAHTRARREGGTGTDDAALIEAAGGTVRLLEGPRWNIKVTVPEDLVVVESLMAAAAGAE